MSTKPCSCQIEEHGMLRILIAVDGSEHAKRAIEAVGKMAKSSLDLEVVLLCVGPPLHSNGCYTVATFEQMEADQKILQDAILSRAMDHARALGLQLVEPARACGVIGNEIVHIASDFRVDQIAMGRRGLGGIGDLLLGSVARRVLQQSTVPVLLVK